jgi:hypothetical protein
MHMDVFVSQTAPQFFLIILLALQIKKKQSVKSFSQFKIQLVKLIVQSPIAMSL